ncbi:MAG: glycoside hydrolase family 38 C-terminal domain-containing protein [Phycisphaerales bacterium]
MLTPNPFSEGQIRRAMAALGRLEQQTWSVDPQPLETHATEPTRELLTFEEGTARPTRRVERLPHHWGKMFDQRWCLIKLGRAATRGDWIHWPGQGEATFYHQGVPFGGTDMSRSHARLPQGATEVWAECVCENVGIWTPKGEDVDPWGCRFDGVFLARRDDDAWRARVDLRCLLDLIGVELSASGTKSEADQVPWGPRPRLDRATPLARDLIARVNVAIDAYDALGPAALAAELDAVIADFQGGDPRMSVVLTGHAHIDLVWRWPERTGEFKAVHSFANALGLMDADDAFVFGYSQPASYEAVQRRSPALMERVRERIAEGRWEPTGALWVESDTQLACGEALARSFLLGQRGFEDLTGKPSPVVWLPDAFGFSGCLPQLALESGATGFFTTKVHWNDTNRFPHAAFVWRGTDGSELLGFVPGTFDYNGEATVERVREAALQQRQSAVFPQSLVPTGVGDGGGGPTEEMCRRAHTLADLTGLPRVRWGRIDRFFEDLAAVRSELPVWSGPIDLEYHRGVQTTGHELKEAFRDAERAVQGAEAAAVATGAGPVDAALWKRLVFAQFHDYIPGSSCGEVYSEHVPELRSIAERARALAGQSLGGGCDQLFNPIAVERTVLHEGSLYRLPALASATAEDARVTDAPSVRATESALESDRVRARFDGLGRMTDLAIDGQNVHFAGPAGELLAFAERPHAFEAWDIDRASLEHPLPSSNDATARVERASGVEAAVAFERAIGRRSRVVVRYRAIAGEPVLRVEYEFACDEPDLLVKAVFPTAYRGAMARYGAPFGSALRGQRPGRTADDAAFEVPASRWATVCHDGERDGLGVISESKYGFGCQSGTMHVSLIRSALVTPWGVQPSLRRDDAGPTHFDQGRSVVRVAIGRAGQDLPRSDQPAMLAESLFADCIPHGPEARGAGLAAIGGDANIIPAWAKPADAGDGWVLRAHEVLGQPGMLELQLAAGWESRAADLREGPTGPSATRFEVRPNAFASVLIRPT